MMLLLCCALTRVLALALASDSEAEEMFIFYETFDVDPAFSFSSEPFMFVPSISKLDTDVDAADADGNVFVNEDIAEEDTSTQ